MPANTDGPPLPRWASSWLWAAGIYNLVWGLLTIAFPHLLFDLLAIPRLNYPAIWQCVGMIVGVYGIGYILAARDSRTHWPIVLVGLLGKIFGPIGFAWSLVQGTFPLEFGLTILTNDLLWWIPFTMILWDALLNGPRRIPHPDEIQRCTYEVRIAAPPEVVFAWHEKPEAFPLLMPPGEPLRVVEPAGSLAVGSRVVLAGRVLGLPVRWIAKHTEYDPPRLFADTQVCGPFYFWYHRHHFIGDGSGGTILRDEIEYVLPLGEIGRRLGGWFVRAKLNRLFDYRHRVTRNQIEGHSA